MSILIGADVVPTDSNINKFKKGNVQEILGVELFDIWINADFRLFNLEVPITDKASPISKQGPNLIAPKSTINGIKGLHPSLITLANNHILDQNEQGLFSTSNLLDKNNIHHIGAGENLNKASEPYIFQWNGNKIGVYTCAEHEFTIATENSAGANPFDPLESLDHIAKLKSKCDYVIVLYHGGKEHYRYPSPYLQKVCRKIVDKGADLVICQHSHCVGSFEEYDKGTIVYGQGNFIFNEHNNEFWNTGLLVKVDDIFNIEYIPIKSNEIGIEMAVESEAKAILKNFYIRSEKIKEDEFINTEYQKFAEKSIANYTRKLAGFGRWKSRFDRRIFKNRLSKHHYSKQDLLAIQNYIECEAHRELLIKGIKEI